MLNAEVIKLLNEQIAKEMYASNLYLSLSSWCYERSFDGAGRFLYDHAGEEDEHAKKLVVYLNETHSKMKLSAIAEPKSDAKTLLEVFEETYKHEQEVTKSINALVERVLHDKDYSTFNFLQWYVAEQHEEEALFRDIVDKVRLLSDNANGLYLADQYIKGIALARQK